MFQKGEEVLGMNAPGRDMHRFCLEEWLKKTPKFADGDPEHAKSAEEIEAEFKRIQRRLKRQATARLKAKT